MQSFATLIASAGLVALASAQDYTPVLVPGQSNLFNCPGGVAGNWCSDSANIVYCNSTGQGAQHLCETILTRYNNGVNATCYNPTPTEGNAACAQDGIVYASASTYTEPGYSATSYPVSSSSTASAAVTSPTLISGDTFACPVAGGNYCVDSANIVYCNGTTGTGTGHLCETILGNRNNGAGAVCYSPPNDPSRALCAIDGVAYGPSITDIYSSGATVIPTTPVGAVTTSAPSSPPSVVTSTSSMVGVPVSEYPDGQPQVTSTIVQGAAAQAGVGIAAVLGALALAL